MRKRNRRDRPALLSDSLLRVIDGAFLSLDAKGRDQLNLVDGSWRELTSREAAAIEVFAVPRTLESGVTALQRRFPDDTPGASLATTMDLVEAGTIAPFALPSVRPRSPSSAPRRGAGMYGCPSSALEDAIKGESSAVVFLGMPYELGVTAGAGGAKAGPAYLRRCSRVAFDYVEASGVPEGWWSPSRNARVLEGVRFADVGDVPCEGAARNGECFEALYEAELALLRAGRFPVVVGGDHSISLPLITAAASVHPGLGVVHFDAHGDMGNDEDMGDWKENCTHGNFMSWVVGSANVSQVVQVGVRNLLAAPPYRSGKVASHSVGDFLERAEAIVEALPADRAWYLSFDVDCLDPSVVAQTGTPVPGGFSYREASRALTLVASRLPLVGMDVVELAAPADDDDLRAGSAVAHLVFETLAQVFEARRA